MRKKKSGRSIFSREKWLGKSARLARASDSRRLLVPASFWFLLPSGRCAEEGEREPLRTPSNPCVAGLTYERLVTPRFCGVDSNSTRHGRNRCGFKKRGGGDRGSDRRERRVGSPGVRGSGRAGDKEGQRNRRSRG